MTWLWEIDIDSMMTELIWERHALAQAHDDDGMMMMTIMMVLVEEWVVKLGSQEKIDSVSTSERKVGEKS